MLFVCFFMQPVLILLWTKYFQNEGFIDDGTERYDFIESNAPAVFTSCSNTLADRCRLTNNRSQVEQSDAVIFHLFDWYDSPSFRTVNQRWIFYNLEPPPHTSQEEQLLKNLPAHLFFNWTMTYR